MQRLLLFLAILLIFGNVIQVYATKTQETKFLKTTHKNHPIFELNSHVFQIIVSFLNKNDFMLFLEKILSPPTLISEKIIPSENLDEFMQNLLLRQDSDVVKFQTKFENVLLKILHSPSHAFISLEHRDRVLKSLQGRDILILSFFDKSLKSWQFRDGKYRKELWMTEGETNNLYIVNSEGSKKLFKNFPEKMENISKKEDLIPNIHFQTTLGDSIIYGGDTSGYCGIFCNKEVCECKSTDFFYANLKHGVDQNAFSPKHPLIKELNDKLCAEKLSREHCSSLGKGKGNLYLTNKNTLLLHTQNNFGLQPWGVTDNAAKTKINVPKSKLKAAKTTTKTKSREVLPLLDLQLSEIGNIKITGLRENGVVIMENGTFLQFQFAKDDSLENYPSGAVVSVKRFNAKNEIWGYFKDATEKIKKEEMEKEKLRKQKERAQEAYLEKEREKRNNPYYQYAGFK